MTSMTSFMYVKDIVALPMDPGFCYARDVAILCKEGKLFAWKEGPTKFAPWVIPWDSFAYFMLYNPQYKYAFLNMNKNDFERTDPPMLHIRQNIRTFLNLSPSYKDEEYDAELLADIFDYPKNQIETMFRPDVNPILRFFSHPRIHVLHIFCYLKNHPDQLERLQERHKMLLANGDRREDSVRHLLMLYSYYDSNGYLI